MFKPSDSDLEPHGNLAIVDNEDVASYYIWKKLLKHINNISLTSQEFVCQSYEIIQLHTYLMKSMQTKEMDLQIILLYTEI